jgi:hypothetical protein
MLMLTAGVDKGSYQGGNDLVLRQCVSAGSYSIDSIGSIGFDMGAGGDQDYCVYWSAEWYCLGDTRAVEWTTHGRLGKKHYIYLATKLTI